jgi:hypothetical protein
MGTRTSRYPSLRNGRLSRQFTSRSPAVRRMQLRRSVVHRPGRGRSGALFLGSDTQQVRTIRVAREIGRALLALGGLAAWAFVVFLIAA